MYLQNCQIIIKNELICKFYKENTQIDREKVNLQIVELFDIFLKKEKNKNSSSISNINKFGERSLNLSTIRSDKLNFEEDVIGVKSLCLYSATPDLIIEESNNFEKINDRIYSENNEGLSSHEILSSEAINLLEQKIFMNKFYDIINLLKKENINLRYSQKKDENDIVILLNKIYSNGDISIVNSPSMMFSRTLFKGSYEKNYTKNYEEHIRTEETVLNNNELCIIKRPNKYNILIKNKDIKINITNEEINDFIQLMEENNCHGVFLSQNSGFVLKPDFHIEIYNKLIIVYVHNVNYNEQKIKMAIDIIDNLAIKLRELQCKDSIYEVIIDKNTLEEINREYQMFIQQKDILINIFKENQKQFFLQIEEFKFPELNKYLSTKFSIPVNKQGFKCELCKKFNGNNLKALAAHKRGCMRKIKIYTNISSPNENKRLEIDVNSPQNSPVLRFSNK
jgi:hypothetical protein